jgi:two-component sensor histidine kinase
MGEDMRSASDSLQAASASLRHYGSSDRDVAPELVVKELQHRIRNVLSVVQCLVVNTEAGSADELRTALASRIDNLSDAYQLIEAASAHRVTLARLLEQTLRPHAGRGNERAISIGPDITLDSHLALPLQMVFHELATNASKHGCLRTTSGSIEVLWDIIPRLGGRTLAIQWRERGGPEVRKPQYKGFGLRLITKALPGALINVDFAPAGLVCRILLEVEPPGSLG